MAEKTGDAQRRLLEDFLGYPFFVGAQSEASELFQPNPNRIAHAMRQMTGWRQITLDPGPFGVNPGPNRIAKYVLRQPHDLVCKRRILRRVLNCMSGERAAVADEVAQQSQFFPTHRVAVRALKNTRQRDVIADLQFIKAPPSGHRQELVIGGWLNLTPQRRRERGHPRR